MLQEHPHNNGAAHGITSYPALPPADGASRPDPPYLSAHPPPQAHSHGAAPDPIPSTAERATQNNGPTSMNPSYPQMHAASHTLDHGAIPPTYAGHYQGQYGESTARGSATRTDDNARERLVTVCPRWPGLAGAASLKIPAHTSRSSFSIAALHVLDSRFVSLLLYVSPTQFIQCQTTNARSAKLEI